jgi:hypothetical protein
MNRRDYFSTSAATLLLISSGSAFANKGKALSGVLKALGILGKSAAGIGASTIAGITSAKAMKELEHAHDDSPLIVVGTYYVLLGERRSHDAMAIWDTPPSKHFGDSHNVAKFTILDLKEVNRTPKDAAVWVNVVGNKFGQLREEYKGLIYLRWIRNRWAITSMKLGKLDK